MSTTHFFILNISMDKQADSGEKKLKFIITDTPALLLQSGPSGVLGFYSDSL